MSRLFAALFFCILGLLMKGLMNLDLSQILIILCLPVLFIFLLFNRQPAWLGFFAIVAGCMGGIEFIYGYFISPILYYFSIAGWFGVLGGILTALLAPIHGPIFLIVAWLVGESLSYVADFFSSILFAVASLFIYTSPFSETPWEKLSELWRKEKNNQ